FASDPVGASRNPPLLRAPNGTVLDSQKYWRVGAPLYDPAQITAPVLLIRGEWDRDTPGTMAEALFAKLHNASWRRYVIIGEATHMLMLEKNRRQLFDEVQLFLETPRPDAPPGAGAPVIAKAPTATASFAEAKQQPSPAPPAPSSSDVATPPGPPP